MMSSSEEASPGVWRRPSDTRQTPSTYRVWVVGDWRQLFGAADQEFGSRKLLCHGLNSARERVIHDHDIGQVEDNLTYRVVDATERSANRQEAWKRRSAAKREHGAGARTRPGDARAEQRRG